MNDGAMTGVMRLYHRPWRILHISDQGRTVMTLLRTLAIVSLFVTPCQAQSVAAPDGGRGALDAFFRVAASIGQEQSVFARSWPKPFDDSGAMSSFRLTAADRLVVYADSGLQSRDTTVRIRSVMLWRDVTDTNRLRQILAETERELTQRFGPPVECSDPLGAPSHLSVPQHVTRFWPRGVQGQGTRMSWTVTSGNKADVALYAGRFARTEDHTLRCDARMP
jgi:hypothetical protein